MNKEDTFSYRPNSYNDIYPNYSNVPKTTTWLIWLLLLAIPFLNIILTIVWAIDDNPMYLARRNFCRAYMILILIPLVLAMVFGGLFFFQTNFVDKLQSLFNFI